MRKIQLAICAIWVFVCSSNLLAASLTFTNTKTDLGKLIVGEKKSAYFYFSNESDKDVVILEIKKSCGCIVTLLDQYNNETKNYDKKFYRDYGYTIPAHSKGRVVATYDSNGRRGRFNKIVTVYTINDTKKLDTIKLSLFGEAHIDENSPIVLARTYKYTIGEHNEIGFRDVHYYGKKEGYSISENPIRVSKNNTCEAKAHFFILSDTVKSLDVILNDNEKALTCKRSVDTLKNGRKEGVLTFTFDTKKVSKEWGIVEKEVTFLINGKAAKKHLFLQFDILEDSVHLTKKELESSPKILALNTYKQSPNSIWKVGSYGTADVITCTIKFKNSGKRTLFFREEHDNVYPISVMKLGNSEPDDLGKIIQERHYGKNYFHARPGTGNDAIITKSKLFAHEGETVEFALKLLVPETTLDIYGNDALTGGIKGACKYNLIEIGPIRTNDPYHNFIYLYLLYTLKDEVLSK